MRIHIDFSLQTWQIWVEKHVIIRMTGEKSKKQETSPFDLIAVLKKQLKTKRAGDFSRVGSDAVELSLESQCAVILS